jgi:hypothetical protein
MITKTFSSLAVAAVLAVGAFGLHGTALAGDWADAVSASSKVTGPRQTVDHSTDWTRALRVENVKGTYRATVARDYGFLQQALARSGSRRSTESTEIAAR